MCEKKLVVPIRIPYLRDIKFWLETRVGNKRTIIMIIANHQITISIHYF